MRRSRAGTRRPGTACRLVTEVAQVRVGPFVALKDRVGVPEQDRGRLGQHDAAAAALHERAPGRLAAGLSSLVMRAQVPLTILFAALALRERPAVRQCAGIAVSALGLGLVGLARGGSVTVPSLLLVLGTASSRAVGNVCTRIAKPDNGFRLVIWSSLAPPLPLLGLSLLHEGVRRDAAAFGHTAWTAWLSHAYSVMLATVPMLLGAAVVLASLALVVARIKVRANEQPGDTAQGWRDGQKRGQAQAQEQRQGQGQAQRVGESTPGELADELGGERAGV
jgi:hypothetical protein